MQRLRYNVKCSDIATNKLQGCDSMTNENKMFITATEMAEMLGISKGHAYKLIRELNSELKKEGYIVISGKIPRDYFKKRWFGYSA